MRKCFLAFSLFAITSIAIAPACFAVEPGHGFHVERYTLELSPDLNKKTVLGVEEIRLRVMTEGLQSLVFSTNALVVDAATADGKPITVTTTSDGVVVALPSVLGQGQMVTLRLSYHGTPKQGLTFAPESAYTSYAACDWMICSENTPGDKAIFALNLHVPAGMVSIAAGTQIGTIRLKDGTEVHQWRTRMPYSTYLYDFAFGKFVKVLVHQGTDDLVYMSDTATVPELRTIFAKTGAMVVFLSEKAGLDLPAHSYTQLLVAGDEAQEAATYSILGRANIDPKDDWAIVHELSHQWWGNAITCASWNDFWLNEGFATFMTAAWKQHEFGQTGYDQELNVARTRYASVKARGLDKPLAFPGEYKGRRVIQYSKGALFLDHLRTLLGEEAFWVALRSYTREYMGGIVTSMDFERSIEKSTGRDLTAVFQEWVFGAERPSQALPGSE